MKQRARTAAVVLVLAILVSVAGQRLAGPSFLPAAGVGIQPAGSSVELGTPTVEVLVAPVSSLQAATPPSALAAADSPEPTATAAPVQAAASSGPVTLVEPAAIPAQAVQAVAPNASGAAQLATVAAPVVSTPPATTAAPVIAPPAPATPPPAPVAPAPVATAAPAGCPSTWFCYPRLGIAGPIVPYSDCGGTTDIGSSIRSFTCISPFYLLGHSYTQFGQITAWRAGDVVFASGRQFVITGAFTQSSCAAPARSIAPLSLQTSLTSGGCGSVLVVQGN